MPTVHFLPHDVRVSVPEGTDLLTASRRAGILIEAPCGGNGRCGRCVVTRLSGALIGTGADRLDPDQREQGMVLACSARVGSEDVSVMIPEQLETDVAFDVATGHADKADGCLLADGIDPTPFVTRKHVQVAAPQEGDGLSDVERVERALGANGDESILHIPLLLMRELPGILREAEGKITLDSFCEAGQRHAVRVLPGYETNRLLGLAIDVGTTTIAVQLVDLLRGESLGIKSGYNGQVHCGADVISRINLARNPRRRAELRRHAVDSINRLIQAVCTGPHNAECVAAVSLAGNTTMTHLLLEIDPEHIRLAPYTPAVHTVSGLCAEDLGLCIAPAAPVRFAPAVASYVGGDITSGILCTGLAQEEDAVELLVDIGTNGEIVLGNREFLMTCACSAGPAFEGGGVTHGMRAAPGAVEDVSVDASSGRPAYKTVDGRRPRGICGTGLLSLIAGLFSTGWIDPNGKFSRERRCEWIDVRGREAAYEICPAGETDLDGPLRVSERDIESLLRAKAAVYAACALMLEQAGLGFDDLETVYIAGAFGHFLDIQDAVTIGLLPDIDRERFVYLGNASLEGAVLTLLSRDHRTRQEQIAQRMTNLELSTTPDYMDQYTAALFLPHTEPARFPSVRRAVSTSPQVHARVAAHSRETRTEDSAGAATPSGKEAARIRALEEARRALDGVDLGTRCPALGLPAPADGVVCFRLFGRDAKLDVGSLTVTHARTGEAVKPDDQTLLLHYLACDVPLGHKGDLISFRELQAGAFYYASFMQRTVEPLVRRFGNDTDALAGHFDRFDFERLDMGDLSARIQAFGPLAVTLVYRRGDDEFPPSAEVLFDHVLKRVFDAEDAAVLAGRICIGLL